MQHLNSKPRPHRSKPISTIKSQFHTPISKPATTTSTSLSINIISNRRSITNIKPTHQRYTLSTSSLSTQQLKPLTHTSYRSLSTTNDNQDSSTTTTHSSNTTQQSSSSTTSTTTPVKKLTFQQAYNRFVLAIHPDLFQPWPKAHEANTIALGSLNEIFTAAKDNNLNGKVLNLTFYVKNNIHTKDNDDDDNGDNDNTNENKQTNSNKKQKKKSTSTTSTLKSTSRTTNDDIPLDTIKTTITIPNINPRDGGVPESTFKKATDDHEDDEKIKKKKSKRHLTIEVPKSQTSQLPRAPATYNHTQLLHNLTQLFHLVGINVDEHSIDRFEFIYGFEPTNTDQVQIDHKTGQPRIINEGLHIQRSVNSAFFNQSQENPITGEYTQQTGFYGFRGKFVDRDDQGHAPDYLIHVLDPRHRVKPIEFPSDFSLIEFIGVTKHHAKKTALATKLHPRSKIIESQLRHRGFKLLFQRFLHPIDNDAGNQGHINAMTQFVKMLRYYFPDYTASGQFEENMSHLPQTPADLVKQAEREFKQSKPHARSDDPNDIFVVRDREIEENAIRDEENRKKGIFVMKDDNSNEIIPDDILIDTLQSSNEPDNKLAYQVLLQRQKLQHAKQQKEQNERIERESDVKGHYINPIPDDPNDILPSHKHVTIPTSSSLSTTTTQSTMNLSQQQLQHDPSLINWSRQKKNDLIDTTTQLKETLETGLDAKKAERKAWNKMTPKEQDDEYGKYINKLRVQRELEHFQQRSRQGASWKPPDDRNHPLYGQIYKYEREINAGGTRNKRTGEAFSLDTVQFDTEIDSITQEPRTFNPFMKRRRQKYKTAFDVMNDEYRKVEFAQMNFTGYNNYSLVPKASASPSLTLGIKDGKPKLTLIEQRRREHEQQILLLSSSTTQKSYIEQLAIEGQISTDNNDNNNNIDTTTNTTETIIQSQSTQTTEDTSPTTATTTTTRTPVKEIQLYADFGDKDQLSENVLQPIRTFPNLGGPSVLGEHYQYQYDEDDTIGVFTEEMYKQVTYFNSIPQPQKTTEEQLKEDNYRITDASMPKETRHTFIGVDFEAARKRDDEAYKKMMEKHNSTNNSYFRNIQRKLQENEVDHLGNPLYPELHLTKDKFEIDENGNITNLDSLITTEIELTDNVFLFCEDAIQPHIDSRGRIVLPLYIPDATNIYGTTKPIPKPISKQHEFDNTTTKTIQKLEEEYIAPFGKRFATADDWGYFLTRKDIDGNIDEKRPDPFKLAQVHKYQSKLDFELLEEFLFIHTDLYHIFADPALDMNLFKSFTTNLKENYSLLHPAVHRLYTNFNNVKQLTFRIYNDYQTDLTSKRTKSNNNNNNNKDDNDDNMNLPIFDELDYTPIRERWEELIDELGPDPTRFDQGVIPSSRIGSIPHLLLPGKNYQPTVDGQNNSIWADPDMGIVYVPYNVNMKSLATFIDHYGYIAVGQRTQHASFSTLYENKIREVKSHFRLKRLVRDPGVNAEAFIDCLQRMYDSRFVYGKQLDGVSLRIGFKYGFTADGWMVIPHNWQ